ncbi:MAG: nuclear transport factor 2 family protein [Bacteroidia bacterium]|nr:nuclear transport factor 2 family protein [Bacteroidia bacterium]
MKFKYNSLKTFFLSAILLSAINILTAQYNQALIVKDGDLFMEIAHMDSVVFNAFNTRDIEKFKTLFTGDLEFYHDKGGLTNYDHTIDFLKTTTKLNNQLKRELVKGSLEVYPIPGYSALEIGAHTFCHLENGKQDCGTFKFVQIWQKKNGEWKISRVVSYGH